MTTKQLQQHTPEPWVVNEKACAIVSEANECLGSLILSRLMPAKKENLDRIVACVNACQGINPEAVQDILCASERLLVGLTKKSTRDCDWYEGIEYDAEEELKTAIAKAKEGQG